MLTRRSFVRGLALTAAGLLNAAALVEEPARRLWALDGTMLGATPRLVTACDMAEAAAFADTAAIRALGTIKAGVDAFAPLSEFRAPDQAAIEQFVARMNRVVAQAPAIEAAHRRNRLLTARSRPSYLRRRAA